jgi:diaminohydroxyphosphoribosylaminopyrimidine deaminase/5-amino-6-(5-phosphoribosylamino)uracil reductase
MDEKWMKKAIELAKKGVGCVNPNPLVGAVVVKNGRTIGQGYHEHFGGPHAEVNAIESARDDLTDATIYVTLEPCSHFGKTPPCVDVIIRSGFKRVVIGMEDPNPLVSGRGIRKLLEAGIEVTVGVMEKAVSEMNRVFIHFIQKRLPYVTMKTAMTLDGKIATGTGDSKWISCGASREKVHEMRHAAMGIMVGIGTVLADNPRLTTRLKAGKGRDPVRIIVDSKGRIPLDSIIINQKSDAKTIIATTQLATKGKIESLNQMGVEVIITPLRDNRVNLKNLMEQLGHMGIDSILLEGGSTLNWSAIDEGIVDEVVSFINPKIIGGVNAKTPVGGAGYSKVSEGMVFENMTVESIGTDLMIRARIGGDVDVHRAD